MAEENCKLEEYYLRRFQKVMRSNRWATKMTIHEKDMPSSLQAEELLAQKVRVQIELETYSGDGPIMMNFRIEKASDGINYFCWDWDYQATRDKFTDMPVKTLYGTDNGHEIAKLVYQYAAKQTKAAIMRQVSRQYRDICIAENAFEHDTGHYNDNYGQRRIALEDLAPYLTPEGFMQLREIQSDVANKVYTQIYDKDNRIHYALIGQRKNIRKNGGLRAQN